MSNSKTHECGCTLTLKSSTPSTKCTDIHLSLALTYCLYMDLCVSFPSYFYKSLLLFPSRTLSAADVCKHSIQQISITELFFLLFFKQQLVEFRIKHFDITRSLLILIKCQTKFGNKYNSKTHFCVYKLKLVLGISVLLYSPL